jgi:hypothetical protein
MVTLFQIVVGSEGMAVFALDVVIAAARARLAR